MTQEKGNLFRNALSVILICIMTQCAEITDDTEFIFPEIGALCVGLWIVNKHVWRVRKWQIPVIFTISAVVGVCIVRYLTVILPLQMELGFFIVAMLLMLFDASITPAVSACMLPVLIGTDSWLYPVVVFVTTLILTVGQFLMELYGIRNVVDDNALKFSVSSDRLKIFLRWLALMLIIAPIAVIASKFDTKYVIVPPLTVTLVEFSNSASGFRQKPFSTFLILVFAAVIGSFTENIMHQVLNIPLTLCAGTSVSVILIFFDRTDRYFAPAVAITLVPMILPEMGIYVFPLCVALGAGYFIFMAEICFCRPVKNGAKKVMRLK